MAPIILHVDIHGGGPQNIPPFQKNEFILIIFYDWFCLRTKIKDHNKSLYPHTNRSTQSMNRQKGF